MGHVFGAHALLLTAVVTLAACGSAPPADRRPAGMPQPVLPPPVLPDTSGWGVHVLAFEAAPNRDTWVGTFDRGMYVLPFRAREWRQVSPAAPTGAAPAGTAPVGTAPVGAASAGAAPPPVNSIAFESDTLVVWYGTAGAGFGRSADGGRSWRSWPEAGAADRWRTVVPRGILVRGDTVYIATTGGLRITADGGASWRCIQAAGPPAPAAAVAAADGCTERVASLPNDYLLAIEVTATGAIHVGHLRGLSVSTDGGRSWTDNVTEGLAGERVRSVRVGPDSLVWALTERGLFADSPRADVFREVSLRVPGFPTLPGGPRAIIAQPGLLPVLVATSYGMLGETATGDFRIYFVGAADQYRPAGDIWTGAWWGPPIVPIGGGAAGLTRVLAGESPVMGTLPAPPRSEPAAPEQPWLGRPIADGDGNPYADPLRLHGAAAGADGAGIRFGNPAGTAVRAVADGVVAAAADGTVSVRHDTPRGGRAVHSLYRHEGLAEVSAGQRVQRGAIIARTGAPDGAAAPVGLRIATQSPDAAAADAAMAGAAAAGAAADTALVDANPQLFLEPLPGTGVVAGRVIDAAGRAVAGAAIYGLVIPYPTERPFSYLRTYAAGVEGAPGLGENFAVGDVPAGTYGIGVIIDGQRVWRRIRVAAGQLTWVEFQP